MVKYRLAVTLHFTIDGNKREMENNETGRLPLSISFQSSQTTSALLCAHFLASRDIPRLPVKDERKKHRDWRGEKKESDLRYTFGGAE